MPEAIIITVNVRTKTRKEKEYDRQPADSLLPERKRQMILLQKASMSLMSNFL